MEFEVMKCEVVKSFIPSRKTGYIIRYFCIKFKDFFWRPVLRVRL
jgi:hypothetical protein